MWKDLVAERSVAKYLLARVLGLYISGYGAVKFVTFRNCCIY